MSQTKRVSHMKRIANAFHFTRDELMLNRQGKLSKSQHQRMWRRWWMGLVLMIILFGLGSVILGVFLWGTAPDGTFSFLPSNTVLGDDTSDPQLFFFGQILGAGVVLVGVIMFTSMIGYAININSGKLYTYRGRIKLEEGFDDNYLQLVNDGRRFDITLEQLKLLEPIAQQRSFAVYYLLTREGIVSLEPV